LPARRTPILARRQENLARRTPMRGEKGGGGEGGRGGGEGKKGGRGGGVGEVGGKMLPKLLSQRCNTTISLHFSYNNLKYISHTIITLFRFNLNFLFI